MKTLKFSGKLFIQKSTIAQLDANAMAGINGGAKSGSKSCPETYTCWCTVTCPDPAPCGCGDN